MAELNFIFVHGLLHLLGHDDETEKKRLAMIALGEKILEKYAQSNKLKFKKAFTVIELVIVCFIIVLFGGLFLANYHTINRSSAIFLAAKVNS